MTISGDDSYVTGRVIEGPPVTHVVHGDVRLRGAW
jgi:hypothetical protein